MTLSEIRIKLAGISPDIRHYFTSETQRDYTYWEETRRLPYTADNVHEEGWRFYVHRYTRDEYDTVAADIFAALDADPAIAVSHEVDYDPDSGYIHHIFECETI